MEGILFWDKSQLRYLSGIIILSNPINRIYSIVFPLLQIEISFHFLGCEIFQLWHLLLIVIATLPIKTQSMYLNAVAGF